MYILTEANTANAYRRGSDAYRSDAKYNAARLEARDTQRPPTLDSRQVLVEANDAQRKHFAQIVGGLSSNDDITPEQEFGLLDSWHEGYEDAENQALDY